MRVDWGSEVPLGGPQHWSNQHARVQAARVADMPSPPCLALRFVAFVVAAAVLVAEPSGWLSLARAQQGQRPSVSVDSIVKAESASRVRLSIQVGPPGTLAKDNFIRIRGLPPVAALTEGHAIAPGTWAVSLIALSNLTIILPAGLQGQSTVAISLVAVDGDVLAEAKMVLAVSLPAPIRQESPRARAGPAALPLPSSERERALGLHAKGIEQLERGNVHAARKFFERATEAGLALSAVALAGT